jgi:lysozyme family protein
MRTPTGEYRIDFFNKYGERLTGVAEPATSFTQAMTIGKEALTGDKASFTVMRCVHNSLDKTNEIKSDV